MRTSTALRVKRLMRTGYGFARKATYASRSFLTLFDVAIIFVRMLDASLTLK